MVICPFQPFGQILHKLDNPNWKTDQFNKTTKVNISYQAQKGYKQLKIEIRKIMMKGCIF